MANNEEFYKIKSILGQIPEVGVHLRRGGKFRFPIYMTDNLSSTTIDSLELSARSYNCLKRAGINTIGNLCERVQCSSDLKNIRNCGKTSVAEIMDSLFSYQYSVLVVEKRGEFLAKVIEMNLNIVD